MAKWLHPLTRTASYGVTNVKNVSTTWIFLLIFIYWFICLLNTDLRSKALAKRTRKFAKPELAYGLAMGGQTDSLVGSQVQVSRKNS